MATCGERLDTLTDAWESLPSHVQLTPASESSRGFTYFVTPAASEDTPTYVVKLAKTDDDEPEASEIYRTALPSEATAIRKLAVEARILTRLEKTDVPVPRVSTHSTKPGDDIPPHILMEYVDGMVLSDTEASLSTAQREQMIEQLGRSLALGHEAFSFERFGELAVVDDELRVADGACRWQEWFDTDIERAIAHLEETPLADRVHPAREWYHDRREALDPSFESTVIHEDLNPLNVLVTRADTKPVISAIVDWEDVMAGPPDLQVTSAVTLLDQQLEALDTSSIRDRFVSGYRSVRSLPVGYEQRASLYDFRQWLQTFSNLQPDLDTADGRGAAVKRYARSAFEEIVET